MLEPNKWWQRYFRSLAIESRPCASLVSRYFEICSVVFSLVFFSACFVQLAELLVESQLRADEIFYLCSLCFVQKRLGSLTNLSGVSFVWWLTATRAPVCILPIVHFVRA